MTPAIQNAYFRVKVSPSFFGGNYNLRSSSFRSPIDLFAIYQPNDQWTFLAGTELLLINDHRVWPIVGFIYKPNDRLLFKITQENPRVFYKLNDQWRVFVEGDGFIHQQFVIKGETTKDRILEYTELMAGAGVQYDLQKNVSATLSTGEAFSRSLRYKTEEIKVSVHDGMYFNASVQIQF